MKSRITARDRAINAYLGTPNPTSALKKHTYDELFAELTKFFNTAIDWESNYFYLKTKYESLEATLMFTQAELLKHQNSDLTSLESNKE